MESGLDIGATVNAEVNVEVGAAVVHVKTVVVRMERTGERVSEEWLIDVVLDREVMRLRVETFRVRLLNKALHAPVEGNFGQDGASRAAAHRTEAEEGQAEGPKDDEDNHVSAALEAGALLRVERRRRRRGRIHIERLVGLRLDEAISARRARGH